MAIAAVQNFEDDSALAYETTASITLSGTTSNNLLVAIVGTSWGTTYTTPTGWTKVEDYTNSSHQVGQATYYKVSDGTETSFSVTLGAERRWAIAVQEFSGLDSTSPFEDSGEDTTYVSTEQTNGDPIPLGSATPSTANGAGICAFTSDARDARDGTLSFSDSYTTDVVHEYDWGQQVPVVGIGHKAYTTTAAQAPDADTSQNVSWRGIGCIAVYKEASSGTVTGTGALASQDSSISGTGSVSGAITGTGALASQASSISGTGVRGVTGAGAIISQASVVAGEGWREITATGALSSQASSVSGTGTVTGAGTITGTGSILVQSSSLSGTGTIGRTGTGALSSQASQVSGTGVIGRTGTGALVSGPSTITGTGGIPGTITGTGSLVCGSSSISGTGIKSGWSQVPPASGSWTEVSGASSTWTPV